MAKQGTPLTGAAAKKAGLVGGAAIALAALVGTLGVWEGKSNAPYKDIVGVPTVCYGETRVQMRRYSDTECLVMLKDGAKGFMVKVAKRNPGIVKDPYMWAAHTSLAYNIGSAAYDKSSVASLYAAGRKLEACDAIGKYRIAGGKVVRGLVLRRQGDNTRMGEVELCKFKG